jgi:hypothetical protein
MSELSERLRSLGNTMSGSSGGYLCCEAADELDRLQARLDFLLGFIACDDTGDEDVVVGAVVDAERLEEALVLTPDCDISGCMMDGWTCNMVKVIDNAIERKAEKARKS